MWFRMWLGFVAFWNFVLDSGFELYLCLGLVLVRSWFLKFWCFFGFSTGLSYSVFRFGGKILKYQLLLMCFSLVLRIKLFFQLVVIFIRGLEIRIGSCYRNR